MHSGILSFAALETDTVRNLTDHLMLPFILSDSQKLRISESINSAGAVRNNSTRGPSRPTILFRLSMLMAKIISLLFGGASASRSLAEPSLCSTVSRNPAYLVAGSVGVAINEVVKFA